MVITDVVQEKLGNYLKPPDYDGLWKKIIGDLFEEFMLFFVPDLHAEIDFTKEHDFLDQELYQKVIKEKKGKNIADQIVKVHLRNGSDKWVLIHVEVQGKNDANFPSRMFRYFYRIYDEFERKVCAIALMTNDQQSTYPDSFHYGFHGTTVDYTYNIYKFYEQTIAELEQSDNPFALAVIAGKYASRHQKDVDQRFHFKRQLMLDVLKRYSKHEEKPRTYITALFYFIDYLLKTPIEYDKRLSNELATINEKDGEQHMHAEKESLSPILARTLEIIKTRELEKAEKRGMAEGKHEAMINFAENLINKQFSNQEIAELTGLNLQQIAELRESLI